METDKKSVSEGKRKEEEEWDERLDLLRVMYETHIQNNNYTLTPRKTAMEITRIQILTQVPPMLLLAHHGFE